MSVCDLTLRGKGEGDWEERKTAEIGRDTGVQTRTAKNEQWASLIDRLD